MKHLFQLYKLPIARISAILTLVSCGSVAAQSMVTFRFDDLTTAAYSPSGFVFEDFLVPGGVTFGVPGAAGATVNVQASHSGANLQSSDRIEWVGDISVETPNIGTTVQEWDLTFDGGGQWQMAGLEIDWLGSALVNDPGGTTAYSEEIVYSVVGGTWNNDWTAAQNQSELIVAGGNTNSVTLTSTPGANSNATAPGEIRGTASGDISQFTYTYTNERTAVGTNFNNSPTRFNIVLEKIPEPSSVLLIAISGLLAILRRRR